MSVQTLGKLIDKKDNIEVVRDQVANLLALNFAKQVTLAEAAQLDPAPWDMRVFLEASNPWEYFREGDNRPIVNVFFENSAMQRERSDLVERQRYEATITIDVITVGRSRPDGEGQITGDREAAILAQQSARLVRNVLMAGENTYLQLRPVVSSRAITAIRMMQAPQDPNALEVIACRLTLSVEYDEYSPQVDPVAIDLITVAVNNETGQLIVAADYDFTGGG